MRISDWSSDVCSSDLDEQIVVILRGARAPEDQRREEQPDADERDRPLRPCLGARDERKRAEQRNGKTADDIADGERTRSPLNRGQPAIDGEDRKSTRLNSSH